MTALPERAASRGKVASHGVFAMIVLVIAETMFFGGLISAHTIAQTSALTVWPPPNQPRLPVEQTLLNTAALLASGVLMFIGQRAYRAQQVSARWFLGALLLGTLFVVLQGMEWAALLREGLTPTSSTHGGFFYLIVGAHAAHAIAAIIGLFVAYRSVTRGQRRDGLVGGAGVYWYFVVVMWPILYLKVYL